MKIWFLFVILDLGPRSSRKEGILVEEGQLAGDEKVSQNDVDAHV